MVASANDMSLPCVCAKRDVEIPGIADVLHNNSLHLETLHRRDIELVEGNYLRASLLAKIIGCCSRDVHLALW